MQTSSANKTGRAFREGAPDALHQVLFAWGKRLFSASDATRKEANEALLDEMQNAAPLKTGPLTLANVSLSNWQQQTMTQVTHALMLNLTKHGRDTDASYVMHLHHIQRAGEISYEQCVDRLQRLCPDEMADLPADVRSKLACIKQGVH